MQNPNKEVFVRLSVGGLDEAIEKANQLLTLLREAQKMIDSLGGNETSDS